MGFFKNYAEDSTLEIGERYGALTKHFLGLRQTSSHVVEITKHPILLPVFPEIPKTYTLLSRNQW